MTTPAGPTVGARAGPPTRAGPVSARIAGPRIGARSLAGGALVGARVLDYREVVGAHCRAGPSRRAGGGRRAMSRAVRGPEYRPADPASDHRLPAGNLPIGRLRCGRLPDRKLPVSNLPVSKLPAGNKIQYWASRVLIILIFFFDLAARVKIIFRRPPRRAGPGPVSASSRFNNPEFCFSLRRVPT